MHPLAKHHQREDFLGPLVLVRLPHVPLRPVLHLPPGHHCGAVSEGWDLVQQGWWIEEIRSSDYHQDPETLQAWRLVRPQSGKA